jgi:hypothetical protein
MKAPSAHLRNSHGADPLLTKRSIWKRHIPLAGLRHIWSSKWLPLAFVDYKNPYKFPIFYLPMPERAETFTHSFLTFEMAWDPSFGAIDVSLPVSIRAHNIKPCIRASYVDIVRNAYNEGSDTNALTFDKATAKTGSLIAGVTASYNIGTENGGK